MAFWKTRQQISGPPAPRLEILARLPTKPRLVPPLLFVHGAWHGAWCWEDHFLDFFAKRGFACYALNLRGHGASRGARDVRFCRVRHFVEDVRDAVDEIGVEPILIGHSLGGFIVQKYLEQHKATLGVLLASIPPNGGARMVRRVMKSQPLAMLKSNLLFSLRPLFSDTKKVRALLFTDNTPEPIIEDCFHRLQDDIILGLLDYTIINLVASKNITTDMLVFGASDDRMIDAIDLEKTAHAYGQSPVVIPDIGHDMMIDQHWERAARTIADEIEQRLGTNASKEASLQAPLESTLCRNRTNTR